MKDSKRCTVKETTHALLTSQCSLSFTVPHAVWQAKNQDKDAAYGKFLAHTVRRKRTATVTSSNGVLTVPVRPNIPETQAKESVHALSEPGSNNYTISSSRALFRATTFSRTRHHVFLLHVSLSVRASLLLVSSIRTGGCCWNALQSW